MPTRSFSKVSIRAGLSALALCAAPLAAQEWSLPPAGGQYDSQLGGAYPPPDGTLIVSRDREDPAASGLYSICYVNAFQSQPQDAEWWRANARDLLVEIDGQPLADPNWPGEYILDIGTPENRDALFAIVAPWIAGCAEAGYQAIEADNLDTYARSSGAITIDDALAFGGMLADYAHSLGLAFAQKNSLELAARGLDLGFDFAIVESCQVWSECGDYRTVYGDRILAIEYTDTEARFFSDACAAWGDAISLIRRDRLLTTPGDPDYHYQTC